MVRKMRLRFLMKFWTNHFFRPEGHAPSLRHELVIGPLCDSPLFRRKARLYYCIRCNWRFLVCEKRVVVLDQGGLPMAGTDSSNRFATFAEGPCHPLVAREAHDPIKAYIVHLKPRREIDERRSLVTGNVSVGSARSRPLCRVFSRVREDLGRHP